MENSSMNIHEVVLFEDNHLLVLDKPAGLLTQPSGTPRESLEEMGKEWLKQKYTKQGNVFLEAVHRLDQAAAGIVVFAKTDKALKRLMKAVREQQVQKIYHALTSGQLDAKEGMLEHYLMHRTKHAEVVSKDTPGARLARLRYRQISYGEFPLVEIHLETGRYHQIRCQLSAIGCPILGDVKYHSQIPYPKPGIALLHHKMYVPHPITGEEIGFESRQQLVVPGK
jgi:23S rRNA pseudouridine1911/1915/1917 synthase